MSSCCSLNSSKSCLCNVHGVAYSHLSCVLKRACISICPQQDQWFERYAGYSRIDPEYFTDSEDGSASD